MNRIKSIELYYRDRFLKSDGSAVISQLFFVIRYNNCSIPSYILINSNTFYFHKHLNLYGFLSNLTGVPYLCERIQAKYIEELLGSSEKISITNKNLGIVYKIIMRSIVVTSAKEIIQEIKEYLKKLIDE